MQNINTCNSKCYFTDSSHSSPVVRLKTCENYEFILEILNLDKFCSHFVVYNLCFSFKNLTFGQCLRKSGSLFILKIDTRLFNQPRTYLTLHVFIFQFILKDKMLLKFDFRKNFSLCPLHPCEHDKGKS